VPRQIWLPSSPCPSLGGWLGCVHGVAERCPRFPVLAFSQFALSAQLKRVKAFTRELPHATSCGDNEVGYGGRSPTSGEVCAPGVLRGVFGHGHSRGRPGAARAASAGSVQLLRPGGPPNKRPSHHGHDGRLQPRPWRPVPGGGSRGHRPRPPGRGRGATGAAYRLRRLSIPGQLLVLADLERLSRSLPGFVGLSHQLDDLAEGGALTNSDPDGLPGTSWGSNWAGGEASVLLADYDWMYDDGPGSPNLDCARPSSIGCWAHRRNILGDYGPRPSMGAAEARVDGVTSMTQLFSSWPIAPAT
jgi:hypothetical protein